MVLIAGVIGYYEMNKLTEVGFDSNKLIGHNYKTVVANLKGSGFTNINTNEVHDLKIEEAKQEGKVTCVNISGDKTFSKDSKYLYDTKVIITYHVVKRICVPISSEDVEGKNNVYVTNLFKKAGFVKIKQQRLNDIITGWINKDGDVKKVTIDGKDEFNKKNKFRPDAKIIITYHSEKK